VRSIQLMITIRFMVGISAASVKNVVLQQREEATKGSRHPAQTVQ
jgi:hypothetical protein